jgi:hypothetical protein
VRQHVRIPPPIHHLGYAAGGATSLDVYHRTGGGCSRILNHRSYCEILDFHTIEYSLSGHQTGVRDTQSVHPFFDGERSANLGPNLLREI